MTSIETEIPAEPSAGGAPPPAPAPPEESMRRRVIRGSMWTILGYGGTQLIRFGSNLVLTRMLVPEMFGTMVLVNTMLIGLHLFSDVGITPAIVQNKRGDERDFLNTAWTIQVLRGVLLFAIACAAAAPMARFYGDEILLTIVPIAAITALCDGLCSTKLISLHRHLRLARATLIEVSSQIVTAVIMISWALIDASIWALVCGTVCGAAFRTGASHLLPGIRNRLRWDPAIARELFHFGRWIFLSTVLTFCADYCDRLVFGKITDTHQLGIYGIALTIALIPTHAISHVGSSVFFPSFSRKLAVGDGLASALRSARGVLSVAGGYLIAGMIAAGQPAVESIYTEEWWSAGWMLQLFAIGAWFYILDCSSGAALLALGRVPWLAGANFAKAAGLITLLPLGYVWGGFPGALLGLAAAAFSKYLVITVGAARQQLPVIRNDVTLTGWVALTGLAGYWASSTADAAFGSSVAAFAVAVVVVTLLWAPLGWALWRRHR